jgi:hypothetical protein
MKWTKRSWRPPDAADHPEYGKTSAPDFNNNANKDVDIETGGRRISGGEFWRIIYHNILLILT